MQRNILSSRLDNDLYNFTMGQLIWRMGTLSNLWVKYRLINRGDSIDIDVDVLKEHIEAYRNLRFTDDELSWLSHILDKHYLDSYLSKLKLPEVKVEYVDGELQVSYEGLWASAVYWETPLLALISELGMEKKVQSYNKDNTFEESIALLNDTVNRVAWKSILLKDNPQIKISEFGTRRRFSSAWQEKVLTDLVSKNHDNILGTSNLMLARKLGLKAMGTMAHQLFMVNAAYYKSLGISDYINVGTSAMLYTFEQEFGHYPDSLIYLPDTFTTEVGMKLFTTQQANTWAGVRQDSGDPFEMIPFLIDNYKKRGIDPRTKRIVASDGLDIPTAIELYEKFGNQTQLSFGIGTNLTNDTDLGALSIVIKPESVNGQLCVKLSDTPGKVTGSKKEAAQYQESVNKWKR